MDRICERVLEKLILRDSEWRQKLCKELGDLDPDDIDQALMDLDEAGIIMRGGDGFCSVRYSFKMDAMMPAARAIMANHLDWL